MNHFSLSAIVLLALLAFANLQPASAQRVNTDSLREARMKVIEAERTARMRGIDSMQKARQHVLDSAKKSRAHLADSLGAIRKYRESKRFKDSVAKSRNRRLDSIKNVRTTFFDSVKTVRKEAIDSAAAVRKQKTDSFQQIIKERTAKMAAVKKYRESKRYKDSLVISRQSRLDSVKAVRKAFNDSMTTARRADAEALKATRKASLDSAMAIRKLALDSLKSLRKLRADSLAKKKDSRERQKKAEDKLKEDKKQLAFELKLKQKREAWNNEKMLKKKWTVPRQVIQNTYTRYNYFFNANNKMEEALKNMQNNTSDQFDSLIALYPFDPNRDSATYAADMDSVIQKASLGIQIHDPRTKWADDLYLLLGQAYYYKGNYTQASNAFRYVISINQQRKMKARQAAARAGKAKKGSPNSRDLPSIADDDPKGPLDFLKHRNVHNQTVLWLSRVYAQSGKRDEAAAILDLLDGDKKLPDNLKGKLALEKAFLALNEKRYDEASPYLAAAAADGNVPDWLRIRCAFLNGQILYASGKYTDAATQFSQAIDLHPRLEMDFYARKNLAYAIMNHGGDAATAASGLRRLLNDNKYAAYYEQIYYVLGRLAANSGDTRDAIANLQRSIASPKTTKKQKATSFAALGNVFYNTGNYREAKAAYDSAAYLGRAAADDTLIQVAARRSKSLDKVTKPMNIIRQQDSLLALAALSPKEQEAIVRKYLRNQQKRKEDSVLSAALQANQPKTMDNPDGNDASWYFSNTALMQQGYNDFKRKWGNRPNVDNWRRIAAVNASNKPGAATAEGDAAADEDQPEGTAPSTSESALLALIPNKPEQRETAKEKIQRAYVDLSSAYILALEDYTRASATLDTLGQRFPKHGNQAEALYLRYQIALATNKLPEAQAFAADLRRHYPDSRFAKVVTPKDDEEDVALASALPIGMYYEETYQLLMQRDYGQVLQRARQGKRQFNDQTVVKRFTIMEAIAHAGTGNYKAADTILNQFITNYPADSLKPWAESVLQFVSKTKPKDSVSADSLARQTKAGMIPTQALETAKKLDSLSDMNMALAQAMAKPTAPSNYAYKPTEPHYVVFSFHKMESKAMGVKAGITDFNTFKYNGQGLTASIQMLQEDQGVITVRQFSSAGQARAYMSNLKNSAQLFKEYKPGDFQFFLVSASNFLKMEKDRDVPGYLKFYQANYR